MVQFSFYLVLTVVFILLCDLPVNVSSSAEEPRFVTENSASKWKLGKLLSSIANVNKERLNALMRYKQLDEYNLASGRLMASPERDPMVAVLFFNTTNPRANKLYEIYDSDIKNVPGDTPVHNLLQEINESNGKVLENKERYDVNPDIEDENIILEKFYNHQIERDGSETSDGEEIIPTKSNIQHREINNAETSDGEEIGSKSGRNNPNRGLKPIANEEKINIGIENNLTLSSKLQLADDSNMNKKHILRLFKSCNKKAVKSCKKACKAAGKDVCRSYRCSSSMKKSFKKHCDKECKSKFSD